MEKKVAVEGDSQHDKAPSSRTVAGRPADSSSSNSKVDSTNHTKAPPPSITRRRLRSEDAGIHGTSDLGGYSIRGGKGQGRGGVPQSMASSSSTSAAVKPTGSIPGVDMPYATGSMVPGQFLPLPSNSPNSTNRTFGKTCTDPARVATEVWQVRRQEFLKELKDAEFDSMNGGRRAVYSKYWKKW
jgi:hypothetical protein